MKISDVIKNLSSGPIMDQFTENDVDLPNDVWLKLTFHFKTGKSAEVGVLQANFEVFEEKFSRKFGISESK